MFGKTCCIVGCSIKELPFDNEYSRAFLDYDKKILQILEKLYYSGYSKFYMGLNKWSEVWAAENLILLSNIHPQIELCVVLPISRSEENNSKEFIKRCKHIYFCTCHTADTSKLCSHTSRAKWVFERCDMVLAIGDPQKNEHICRILETASRLYCTTEYINPRRFLRSNNTRKYTVENLDSFSLSGKAILRRDHDANFEDEDGITLKQHLRQGEIIEYFRSDENSYFVFKGKGTLTLSADEFSYFFRPLDYKKFLREKRYYAFDEFYTDIVAGEMIWIHDFKRDSIMCGVVVAHESTYIMETLFDPIGYNKENDDMYTDPENFQYLLEDYGTVWAALRDRYEGQE